MAPSLSDVPDRYDVVIQLNDGTKYGFLLADSVESNLPFRTHKALYSYSPTFLERQNVSQQYGDNFQDFFLTGSQDDFSLGEQQKFFRVNDQARSRRYFAGLNVDPVTVPGNVTLTQKTASLTLSASSVQAVTPVAGGSSFDWLYVDSTNVYAISNGVISSSAAHGVSSPVSMTADYANSYIGSDSLGAGVIKKVGSNNPSSVSSFATTSGCSSLCYVDNILFGIQGIQNSVLQLLSFDTSGTPTSQFQWKNADGSQVVPANAAAMVPYGGDIYILFGGGPTGELWKYDGSGVLKLSDFPTNFNPTNICVAFGIVYVGGFTITSASDSQRPQVYFYVNGSLGKLWESQSTTTLNTCPVSVTPFGNGIAFQDPITNNVLQYDITHGGVHTIATLPSRCQLYTSNGISSFLAVDQVGLKTGYIYPGASYNSTGYIQTSQYDFDNTLSKVIRGIKIDADIPANTSIDLAYQLDGCGGTYTTLQTGATSGTEYLLPASTSAHSISVRITLNSATGSATPTLKRVYVRAAPTLQQFRRREYLFDLSGGLRDELGKSSRRCRDGTPYPYDPKTAANNLRTIATQTIPFTVQDRFDQFTALADLQENSEGYDGFAIYEIRPDVFIGRINLREV